MEIHQLRYFVAVADIGNFTRAAERCLVAQPSLSQQIIKLERELGQPLFERLGRKIRLTEAGHVLYDQARQILNVVDNAKQSVNDAVESGTGTLTVGVIPTIAPYLMPALLQPFVQRYPGAEIVIRENFTEFTVADCLQGDLDLGILALPIDGERLEVEPLYSEELLLAVPAGHPLATKRRVTTNDMMKERFILLNETHCLGEQIIGFCKGQSCLPAISCESAQLLTVQELVALGHGISLVPEMAAANDQSGRVIYRSLAGTRPKRTLCIIRRTNARPSLLVREFLGMLRERAETFEAAGK